MYRTYNLSLFKWTVPQQMGRGVAQALIDTKVMLEDEIRRLLVICGMNKRRRNNTNLGQCPVWMDLEGWVPNPDLDDRLRNLRIFIEKKNGRVTINDVCKWKMEFRWYGVLVEPGNVVERTPRQGGAAHTQKTDDKTCKN